MNIEVLDLHIQPNESRVGIVFVRYGDLMMQCDLVYFYPEKKIWIRMPEKWVGNEKKRYCFWPSREISNVFQEKVVNEIFAKFNISIEEISIIYRQKQLPKENR